MTTQKKTTSLDAFKSSHLPKFHKKENSLQEIRNLDYGQFIAKSILDKIEKDLHKSKK